jgi:hypothetical protein
MVVLRKLLGVLVVLLGIFFLVHANRRRYGPRLQSRKPIAWWRYFMLGARPIVENPTERELEIDGIMGEAIAGAAGILAGVALIVYG